MNWIINEKIRRPFTFSGCVFICSINMMMINACLRLLFYAGASQKADWYQESLDWQLENVSYFWQRSESITMAIGVAACFVIGFSIFVLTIFRKMLTEEKKKIMGVYFTCGYGQKVLWKFLEADRFIYLLFSIPFAMLLTVGMMALCKQRDEFRFIIFAGNNFDLAGLLSLFCSIIFVWIVMKFTDRHCMNRIIRKPVVRLMKE